jgi:4-hydroxybenzoate polyprenyltransferase
MMSKVPKPDVLIVDLDHTLIRTDMLFETLWAALSQHWLNLVAIVSASGSGRANLKSKLAELGPVPPEELPYNKSVLDLIGSWKDDGGQVILVSATDQVIVSKISIYLGVFDAAYGSNGHTNLKGVNKANFLLSRFPDGFAYVGDSQADLDIWQNANLAITVDASASVRAHVDALDVKAKHLDTREVPVTKALLKAIRPHQWIKNALVFLPMVLSHNWSASIFGTTLLAFIAFCLIASSVYLLNDLLDLSADRSHPRKRLRPFAAGALPLAWGSALAPGLLFLGIVLSAMVGWQFFGIVLIYYILTTLYSFSLKRKLIVDIFALAGLYTIRIVAGGVATDITLSVWLLAFSIFFFFSLAAVKRQSELKSSEVADREQAYGRSYLTTDLPIVSQMAISAGYVAVLISALYLNSDIDRTLYANPTPLWGICLVLLYWISRLVMISHRGWMHDDPVVFAVTDRNSWICAALILGLAVAANWM